MKKKAPRLTGDALAKACAITFSYLGNVYGMYEGGGWIVIRGEGLEPHPDLKEMYPNGWSMLHRMRCNEARQRIREAAR